MYFNRKVLAIHVSGQKMCTCFVFGYILRHFLSILSTSGCSFGKTHLDSYACLYRILYICSIFFIKEHMIVIRPGISCVSDSATLCVNISVTWV